MNETDTICHAWVLIPNHAHFLFRTGHEKLGKMMQRLQLGYAQWFNRRHNRIGHLFHNRYKSILCEDDPYFLELVRYVHLNPLRAGLVQNYDELCNFPWSGHRTLLNKIRLDWQDVDGVLSKFGRLRRKAVFAYDGFVRAGVVMGRREDLIGGGLIRSLGGMEGVRSARRSKMLIRSDDRILGSGEFVSRILAEKEHTDRRKKVVNGRMSPNEAVSKAAILFSVPERNIHGKGKHPNEVRARAIVCKWLVEDMGLPGIEVADFLGISSSAVTRCVIRGRQVGLKYRVSI